MGNINTSTWDLYGSGDLEFEDTPKDGGSSFGAVSGQERPHVFESQDSISNHPSEDKLDVLNSNTEPASGGVSDNSNRNQKSSPSSSGNTLLSPRPNKPNDSKHSWRKPLLITVILLLLLGSITTLALYRNSVAKYNNLKSAQSALRQELLKSEKANAEELKALGDKVSVIRGELDKDIPEDLQAQYQDLLTQINSLTQSSNQAVASSAQDLLAKLTNQAGTGISLSPDGKTITNTGVLSVNDQTGNLSIQGTTNQTNVTQNGTTTTIGTAQDIAQTSSPTFNNQTLTGSANIQGGITVGGTTTTNNLTIQSSGTQNGYALCDASNNCGYSGAGSSYVQGGNSFGNPAYLGTNDNNSLNLETNGTTRLTIDTAGNTGLTGNLTTPGSVSASSLSGNGSGVTNVDATALNGNTAGNNSGQIALNNGTINTNLNSDLLDGQHGSYYQNASNVNAGTLADARLSSNVTLQGNSFNGINQLVQLNGSGYLPALNGSLVTNVDALTLQGNNASYFTNASNIASGTLSDLRLSSNVPLKNGTNIFTGTNNFAGITATGILQGGYSVCDASNNCNYAPISGSGNYIHNGTATQTANANIQSSSALSIGMIIQGAVGQIAHLQEWRDSSGNVVANVHNSYGLRVGNQSPWPSFSKLSVEGSVLAYGTSNIWLRPNDASGPTVASGGSVFRLINEYPAGNILVSAPRDMHINSSATGATSMVRISTQNIERIRLHSTGNLSIGTISDLGQLAIVNTSTSQTGLVVRGASGQTANLQEWQNSSGTVLSRVANNGDIQLGFNVALQSEHSGGGSFVDLIKRGSGNSVYVGNSTADTIVQGGTYIFLKTSSSQGGIKLYASEVSKYGSIGYLGSSSSPWNQLFLQPATGSATPLYVRAWIAQTGNLTEWQNSSGTVLSMVTADGRLGIGAAPGTNVALNIDKNANQSQYVNQTLTVSAGGQSYQNYYTFKKTYSDNSAVNSAILGGIRAVGHNGSAEYDAGMIRFDSGTSPGRGDIYISTADGSVLQRAMAINYNGNVGIGVSVPANTARLAVVNSLASTKGLVIQGAASQTANLQEWQDSSGVVLANVSSAGRLQMGTSSNNSLIALRSATTANGVPAEGVGVIQINRLVDDGGPSSNSSGAIFFGNSSVKMWRSNNTLKISSYDGFGVDNSGGSTSGVVMNIQGTIGQTGDLQRWQNSSGTVLAALQNTGNLTLTQDNANLNIGSSQKGYVAIGTQGNYSGNFANKGAMCIDTACIQGDGGGGLTSTGASGAWGTGFIKSGGIYSNVFGSYGNRVAIMNTLEVLSNTKAHAGFNITPVAGIAALFGTSSTSNVNIASRAIAGQTADLLQAQDSVGTVLARITATGDLTVKNASVEGAYITFSNNIRGYNVGVTASATSQTVSFNTAHPDANYAVFCTPDWNTSCYVTNKTTNGFTLNYGTAAPAAQQVDWFVAR